MIHNFTLTLDRLLSDQEIELLYANGLDNTLCGQTNNIPTVEVDVEASSLTEAIISTIKTLKNIIPTVQVIEVQGPDLVTLPEIATLTGRTRQSIHQLATNKRGPGGWPSPMNQTASPNRFLWRLTDIAIWWAKHIDPDGPMNPQSIHAIAAINAQLRATRELHHLPIKDQHEITKLAA